MNYPRIEVERLEDLCAPHMSATDVSRTRGAQVEGWASWFWCLPRHCLVGISSGELGPCEFTHHQILMLWNGAWHMADTQNIAEWMHFVHRNIFSPTWLPLY